MKQLATLACVFLLSFQLNAQSENPAPIIFIYDASGSMWGQMQNKTKMQIAAEVLSTSVNKLPDNQHIGLVAYGHREKGDCKDVETLVEMSNGSKNAITSAIQKIKPLGKTPLAYSATTVIDQLRKSNEKATIILITDGIESCSGNICDVVKAAKKEGIDFKLHIVGFGLKAGETDQLKCAANAGDGNYYDAADATGLGEAMNEVVTQTIDKKEGNFGVYATKNNQPVDAYIRAYKAGKKELANSLRTYGETRYMFLPTGTYDLEAKPVAGDVKAVFLMNQESFDDKKTERTISFDGGKVLATTTNNGEGWDTMVKLIDQNGNVSATLRTYGKPREMEVNPGSYKVTFQALAMKGLETASEIAEITVKAGETKPVAHDFKSGTVTVFAKIGNDQIDSIVEFKEKTSGKSVDSGRTYNKGKSFLLNPGNYTVSVKPIGKNKDKNAQEFSIDLKAGENIDKTLSF